MDVCIDAYVCTCTVRYVYVPLELKEMGSGYHESFVDA